MISEVAPHILRSFCVTFLCGMALLALKVAESRYPSTLKSVGHAVCPAAVNAEPAFNSLYKINNLSLACRLVFPFNKRLYQHSRIVLKDLSL